MSFVASPSRPREPEADDLCAVLRGQTLLQLAAPAAGGPLLPTMAHLRQVADALAEPLCPLGTLDGRQVWLFDADATDHAAGSELTPREWLSCLAQPDPGAAALAGRAFALGTFLRTHRFCGACGTGLEDHPRGLSRLCPACGLIARPRPLVAALVAMVRGSTGARDLLLAEHTYGPASTWALVGGLLDPAETPELAAAREVAEEVGLEVTDLTYVGSQAWGFTGPDMLLLVFTGRAVDPDAVPVVDGHELARAQWFPLTDLPTNLPPAPGIARTVINSLRA